MESISSAPPELGRSDILIREYLALYKKHIKHKTESYTADPVSTQIFVQNMNDSHTLPPLFKLSRNQTQRDRSALKRLQMQRQLTSRQRRYHSINFDSEVSDRLIKVEPGKKAKQPDWERRKKKFIEVDMLLLETCYANSKIEGSACARSKNQQKLVKIQKIPPKDRITDFIKNYRAKTEEVNVDDIVRSPFFGVQYKEDAFLYFGEMQKELMDGKGVLVTKNWIFEGEFMKAERIKGAEITDKGIFKGKFIKNQRGQIGEFLWHNGEYYSGQWFDNQKHGKGVWKSPNGDIYMGMWKEGKVEGFGTHLSRSGQKYQGFFQNFLKHGQGHERFPNGDIFEGLFKDGKPEGRGKYQWKSGVIYDGEFKAGLRQGSGKMMKQDMRYEGQFSGQKAHGEGRLMFVNGNNYVGQFRRGKKEGKGIFREKGRIFMGFWQNNKFIFKS